MATKVGLNMKKSAFILAALLAVSFAVSGAEAAKKKRSHDPAVKPDPIAEWNKKNFGPPAAAAPAKAKKAMKGKKAKKKTAKAKKK